MGFTGKTATGDMSGMQLLANCGIEGGQTNGLGLVPEEVISLSYESYWLECIEI